MQNEEWDRWADHHATIFGLRDDDVRMVNSWRPIFAAAGYVWMELMDATDWLACNAPPRFRSEHLPALHQRILQLRAVQYARQADTREPDLGTCTICQGNGFVTVPHPRGVQDGNWLPMVTTRSQRPTFYTAAVLCCCALGRWKGQRRKVDEHHPRLMTLEEYERINPRWLAHLQARDRQHVADAKAQGPLGSTLEAILARLQEQSQ